MLKLEIKSGTSSICPLCRGEHLLLNSIDLMQGGDNTNNAKGIDEDSSYILMILLLLLLLLLLFSLHVLLLSIIIIIIIIIIIQLMI